MQRYEPTSGMIVTVQGGAYVRYSDAQAEIERLKAENKSLREFVGIVATTNISGSMRALEQLNLLSAIAKELAKLYKGGMMQTKQMKETQAFLAIVKEYEAAKEKIRIAILSLEAVRASSCRLGSTSTLCVNADLGAIIETLKGDK